MTTANTTKCGRAFIIQHDTTTKEIVGTVSYGGDFYSHAFVVKYNPRIGMERTVITDYKELDVKYEMVIDGDTAEVAPKPDTKPVAYVDPSDLKSTACSGHVIDGRFYSLAYIRTSRPDLTCKCNCFNYLTVSISDLRSNYRTGMDVSAKPMAYIASNESEADSYVGYIIDGAFYSREYIIQSRPDLARLGLSNPTVIDKHSLNTNYKVAMIKPKPNAYVNEIEYASAFSIAGYEYNSEWFSIGSLFSVPTLVAQRIREGRTSYKYIDELRAGFQIRVRKMSDRAIGDDNSFDFRTCMVTPKPIRFSDCSVSIDDMRGKIIGQPTVDGNEYLVNGHKRNCNGFHVGAAEGVLYTLPTNLQTTVKPGISHYATNRDMQDILDNIDVDWHVNTAASNCIVSGRVLENILKATPPSMYDHVSGLYPKYDWRVHYNRNPAMDIMYILPDIGCPDGTPSGVISGTMMETFKLSMEKAVTFARQPATIVKSQPVKDVADIIAATYIAGDGSSVRCDDDSVTAALTLNRTMREAFISHERSKPLVGDIMVKLKSNGGDTVTSIGEDSYMSDAEAAKIVVGKLLSVSEAISNAVNSLKPH